MAKKKEVRFVVADDEHRYSAVWWLGCAKNRPDIFVMTKNLAGIQKLTLHAPRDGMSNWKVHVRRDTQPYCPTGVMNDELLNCVAHQPVNGLICVSAICVPHSQRRRGNLPEIHPQTVRLAPPAVGMQVNIVVWVALQEVKQGEWPGSSRSAQLVWSQQLINGHWVYVTRTDEIVNKEKLPKAILNEELGRRLRENPHLAMLITYFDQNGVVIFVDFLASALLPHFSTEST